MTQVIFGMHDYCPESIMPRGKLLIPIEVGHSSEPHPGVDFAELTGPNRTAIGRIQHAWGTGGTIPLPRDLDGYMQRVISLVANSQGCHRWVIGNEVNFPVEWPEGQPITPAYYAQVYNTVRTEIHALPGHAGDEVILAPIAPWNVESGMGWIEYFVAVLALCPQVDAIALHAYSRGPSPESIVSEDKMDAPFGMYYNGFRAYRDFLNAIPARLRDVPVYITEANQIEPWWNGPNTWAQAAYREIDDWNHSGGQAIHCLILYRWPKYDQWFLEGLGHVADDFRAAQAHGYSLPQENGDNGMNELLNPSFELPYSERGAGEVKVSHDWKPFYIVGETIEGQGPTARPEYKPLPRSLDELRVIDGDTAQCWFTNWKVHDAGIYQRITGITVGATITFRASGQVWCSESDDPRADDAELYFRLGIDREGGTDAYAGHVVWTDFIRGTAEYQEAEISAIAQATAITVFVRSWNKWPVKHNDMYVDKASLIVEGGNGGTPPIPPPTGGTLQGHIDAVQAGLDVTQAALDRMKVYIATGAVRCLLIE